MKLLIAMMSHETNTFSPVPTELERFGSGLNPPEDISAYQAVKGRGITMAGMISVAEEANIEVVTPIAAGSPPSGPVSNKAFDYITDRICDAVSDCDGLLLDLHGAMVTERHEDGEGALLSRLRSENPDIPIGVGLDMHTNLFPDMVSNSTVITGYQTYPHIDMFETGARAARILIRSIRGEIKPTMVWGNCPMLPHVMRQGTDDYPNKALQQRVAEMERDDALAVTLFTGFPHADIYNAGLSVVVVADDDRQKAEALRDELLEMAWDSREAFVYKKISLSESISEANTTADAAGSGPVILLDHYDNTASGGTMDTTEVLREIIRQELDDVAAFGIFDPDAVSKMVTAGVGQEVTLSLGANFHMDALQQQSRPLEVTGIVRLLSDGKFTITGPMSTGSRMNMGTTAVLDTGKVLIVVISRHVEPYDLGCFSSLGIDPLNKRFLMLKSRIHYRAAYMPIAKKIIECAGCGVCTSDYDQVQFKRIRRPIYPLDNINARDFKHLIQGS
ncbi:MAG: M81 family metallopeptidase [Pseudomonadales bacterium]|jgi:microcystin degradation protein MlrC|nr:M81 family metallopeptidase [Pseudomonadales bacterium]MDP6315272.1 M81 family metallopeptidase [Pseudomonadales bacterium]MDP7314535.1 M81 family metallopeptidase [Pseudomonadales bacterium]|tara:strand:+ start:1354 stop:2868 length:1515 start_codon:yes stop_codon:yes gene_type:complete